MPPNTLVAAKVAAAPNLGALAGDPSWARAQPLTFKVADGANFGGKGETDVSQNTPVRIQLSRDIDPATLKGNIHVSYLQSETVERGEPVTPTAAFTPVWSQMNRELELKFSTPLERFRTVKIKLTDGIKGTDGQPLKPWTLTFQTGGS